MAQATKTAKRTRKPGKAPAATARRPWRRRLKVFAVAGVLAWLLVSYFVVRTEIRDQLAHTFDGEARVAWVMLWPNLDATAYGVTIEAEHHRIEADRVWIDVRALGVFGGRVVESLDISGFTVALDEGEPLALFREHRGAGKAAGEGADLDPMKLPPIRFRTTRVELRRHDGDWDVWQAGRVDVEQTGDRTFAVETGPGVLAEIPFEKITARVIPSAGHLLIDGFKMRSFNGLAAGVLDIHTDRAGAFNGELDWAFVEAERIWTEYELPYAEKRRGDLSGHVVFRADRPALDALSGTARVSMRRGNFFSPLSFKVFLTLKIPVAAEAPLTSADLRFSFEKSLLYLEHGRADARKFALEGQGILAFDGGVDLEVAHAGTTVSVSGAIDDPRIKVLPLSHVTLPFDRLFRERVGK